MSNNSVKKIKTEKSNFSYIYKEDTTSCRCLILFNSKFIYLK